MFDPLTRSVEFFGVTYAFGCPNGNADPSPPGYVSVGQSDGLPICQRTEDGKVFLYDADTAAMHELGPSVEAFCALAGTLKAIDPKLPDSEYLSAVRGAIRQTDPALLASTFWGPLVWEIENGVL